MTLDLRGLSPSRPVQPGEWCHRVRTVDFRGRVALPEVAEMTDCIVRVLHPTLATDGWELRVVGHGGGVRLDSRLRVVIPIGVRHQLGLGRDVVVSLPCDRSRIVVWAVTRLDALLVSR